MQLGSLLELTPEKRLVGQFKEESTMCHGPCARTSTLRGNSLPATERKPRLNVLTPAAYDRIQINRIKYT